MHTKILPCKLTEQELHDYSMSLARITAKLQATREDKKASDAEFNKEIKALSVEIQKLAVTINKGYEDKNVEVEWAFDWDRKVKTMHRLDTGEVVMRDAPIEPHEKQGTLVEVEFKDRAASGDEKPAKKVYGIKKAESDPDKEKGG